MDKKYMYNILVIDDETGVTKSLFRQFRRKYNVFTANSGQEAIAIMKEENIQIVISDQRMPGMTGLDFFSLIKDNYPDAIKIMLSGYSDIEAVIGAINEGQVFRYISKPWKPEELSNLLAEATEKYELITKNKRLTQTLEKCDNQLKEFLIAQKQAGAAEEKFRKIANTARVSISIMAIGLEKGILYVNEYWQKITGYTKEESLQLGALDIVHPDHRPMVAERAAKRIAGNAETDHYELKILTKSGETRWVDLTATLINYEGIPASIATALDITDRKQNQMDLIEAKEKAEQSEIKLSESLIDLHLAQKIASIGNWQFDPEIGIPVWSDEIFNIYERDKKLGPPHVDEYRKMYDKEQFEIFTTAFHTAITEGLSYGIVLKFVSPKNNEKWIHAICQPDKTRKGKKGYFLRGTIQDITESKRIASEREMLTYELQEALANIRVLSGLVPICSKCKKIRDDKGYWSQIEGYI